MRAVSLYVGLVVIFALAIAMPRTVATQGSQSGSITGRVTDPDGASLPGVTVTAVSPALQGERTVFSGGNGGFLIAGLPPGAYEVTFQLDGMAEVKRTATVSLGQSARSDARMELAELTESITVTDEIPTPLANKQVGVNFTFDEVDALPIGREPLEVANFAPGVSDRAVFSLSISGGIGYDNLTMLDGVDVGFFIFGGSTGRFPEEIGLFIEEAVDETQVLTGTIPAEYGRFAGGVVNAVTKTGGNEYAGSFRIDLTNPSWRDETPFEERVGATRESNRNELYSATFGGPFVSDRFWFFAAGADTSRSDPGVFPVTGLPRPADFDNQRWQAKLTGTFGEGHTLEGVRVNSESDQVEPFFGFEPNTVDEATFSHDYAVFRYAGVLGNNLLLEARYSERNFETSGIGGTSMELPDSPIFSITLPGGLYNAPPFDEREPSLKHDDETFAATFSYFVASERAGSHDLKAGLEHYVTTQYGGNSQSATGFIFDADYLVDDTGAIIYDAQGRLQPVFAGPFGAFAFNAIADIDAVMELETGSLFVNDLWRLNDHWSFNLGFRYEEITGVARGQITTQVADTDSFVPRLAATYDPKGDGRFRFTAGYAEYVGRANQEFYKQITTSRNYSWIYSAYIGPPGIGHGFEPGWDLANYIPIAAQSPTVNVSFEPGLSPPTNEEITLSAGMALSRGGFLELSYVERSLKSAIEDTVTFDNGQTLWESPVGPILLDNVVYRNTNQAKREYSALQLQGRTRLRDNWTLDGHWTWELENDGNLVGENLGNPAVTGGIVSYPEIFTERRTAFRRLPGTLEHKVRLWTNYLWSFGRAGDLNAALLFRYDSAPVFNVQAGAGISEIQASRDPGYAAPPSGQGVFFGERGSGEFEDVQVFDLALNYRIRAWKRIEPWIKLEVRNMFNQAAKISWNTSVRADFEGPVDADGIPTEFIPNPGFGETNSSGDYFTPREYFVSLGVRF